MGIHFALLWFLLTLKGFHITELRTKWFKKVFPSDWLPQMAKIGRLMVKYRGSIV